MAVIIVLNKELYARVMQLEYACKKSEDDMSTSTIKKKELFKISGEALEQIYYGSNQDWYEKRWQRMSGCGPSAVANIIYYMNQTQKCCSGLTKSDWLLLMNEIWKFVTPGLGGVSSTSMLCEGVNKYLIHNNLDIKLDCINIPKKRVLRPDFDKVLSFLTNALENDTPVAFLNLEHGTVYELESWHWVTIISMEYGVIEGQAFAEILDGGLVKKIDLLKWFQTTKLGGGFVSFDDR